MCDTSRCADAYGDVCRRSVVGVRWSILQRALVRRGDGIPNP
jgi:hypothetical protein